MGIPREKEGHKQETNGIIKQKRLPLHEEYCVPTEPPEESSPLLSSWSQPPANAKHPNLLSVHLTALCCTCFSRY